MEDREFFDLLYQQFAKTTEAKDSYWMYEEEYDSVLDFRFFKIFAVSSEEDRTLLGVVYNEADAEFITALHGCFPDLVRRMHDALDEADRLDEDRDNQEVRVAELIEETSALNRKLSAAVNELDLQTRYAVRLEDELSEIQWRMDGLEK